MAEQQSHHTFERYELARYPSGVPMSVGVHTYEGERDGPTVYIQGAQHGREVNGTAVLRRLHERLDPVELAGRVVTIPVADPITFDHVSYTTPEAFDMINNNMNRVWPGNLSGSLHQRMAARLWELAGEADVIVDLHTGTPEIATHVVYLEEEPETFALAEAFGTDLLIGEPSDREDRDWPKTNFEGLLHVAATRRGIPAITPELAHNKEIVEDAVEIGVTGLFNILKHLDMLPGEPEENGETRRATKPSGSVVEAPDSGLFRVRPTLAVGDEVEEGDFLGTLYDAATFETVLEVRAPMDGFIVSLDREATKASGHRLIGIAQYVE